MKTLFFLMVFSSLYLASCSNEVASPERLSLVPVVVVEREPSMLTGDWVWVRSEGGYTGSDMIMPVDGESQVIVFSDNGTFSLYRNDTLIETASYTVDPADRTLIFSSEPDTSLTLTGRRQFSTPFYYGLMDKSQIRFYGDSIVINSNVYDGYRSVYKRSLVK